MAPPVERRHSLSPGGRQELRLAAQNLRPQPFSRSSSHSYPGHQGTGAAQRQPLCQPVLDSIPSRPTVRICIRVLRIFASPCRRGGYMVAAVRWACQCACRPFHGISSAVSPALPEACLRVDRGAWVHHRRRGEISGTRRWRGSSPVRPGAAMSWAAPDEVVDHGPAAVCNGCGTDLAGAADLGAARSLQQLEVPPLSRAAYPA